MKFVIIGLGHRGKKYFDAVAKCHEAKLVAVCDANPASGANLPKETHFYCDIEEMLAKEKIDVAIVAVPHHLYLDIIKKLAAHKIHIIKEKPFATSLQEAQTMHEILKSNGVEMMIATQRRFDKHYEVGKRMLKQLGAISHVRGSYTLNIDRLDDGWRASQQSSGGGALSDMGYHFIDLLIWYFGLPTDITCSNTTNSKSNQDYNVEDSTFLNFEYMHNAEDVSKKTIGSFFLSRVSIETGEHLIVQGQNGCLKLTPDKIVFYNMHNVAEYTLKKEDTPSLNPLVAMVEHFVHYLKGDVRVLCADYKTHLQHVRVMEAAYHADRHFNQHQLSSTKQKMMLFSPPTQRNSKRERSISHMDSSAEPIKQKLPIVERASTVTPDFVWPLITERTKQHMMEQMTADNISCYNRSGIIEKFENNFAHYHGRKFAMSTNSGTSAIHALYSALSLKQGDEVLVPSNTFHATVSPLMHTGATPIFVDCLANGNIDPQDMQRKITPRTKAAMITHMWGIPCDMDRIVEFCQANKLALLEDCSHAHGARYRGKLVGTFGLAAAWSFNGPKIISGGEGGMILTDDKDFEVRCNLLGQYNNRSLQITPVDHPLRNIALTGLGLKHRITTIAAAMANEQLEHLDEWLNWKRLYANMFRRSLSEIPFITLPDIEHTQPAWYAFTFYFDEVTAGVTREVFIKLLHQADLKEVKTPGSTCPQEQLELYRQPSRFLPHIYSSDPESPQPCVKSQQLYQACIKLPMWAQSSDLGMVNKYISGIVQVAADLIQINENKEKQLAL